MPCQKTGGLAAQATTWKRDTSASAIKDDGRPKDWKLAPGATGTCVAGSVIVAIGDPSANVPLATVQSAIVTLTMSAEAIESGRWRFVRT